MEGQRASKTATGTTTTTTSDTVNDDVVSPPAALPPPPRLARHDNMYIVQFPKDQIYRVPPRENALIVEQYRNPKTDENKNGKRSCCCCCSLQCLLTIAIILITIIAVFAIAIAILFFIFNPSGPTFAINHFAVKNVTGPPHYDISLRARNPNQRLGIIYETSEVSMIFEDIEVATGKFPTLLEQGRHALTQFKVDLTGKQPFPKKTKNTPLDFELDMDLCVRITAMGLSTWIMNANVVCKFEVNNLGNDSRILSQQCDTNFRQY